MAAVVLFTEMWVDSNSHFPRLVCALPWRNHRGFMGDGVIQIVAMYDDRLWYLGVPVAMCCGISVRTVFCLFQILDDHSGALPCWKMAVKDVSCMYVRSSVCLFSWVDGWHDWMLTYV